MFETLSVLPPDYNQGVAALLASCAHLPPAGLLYGAGFIAHTLGWHRLVPWVYLGLAITAFALD